MKDETEEKGLQRYLRRSQKETVSNTEISENVTHFTGCCSTPSLLGLRRQSSNFRQRSRRVYEIGESSTVVNRSSPSTSEPQQQVVVPSFTTLAIDKEQSSIV